MDNTVLKRVAAIHDISCLSKCSLTVALPIISAAGIETSVIPTSILSTPTGVFDNFTFMDLTDEMLPIVRHWVTTGVHFDAIYSGFLGSAEQVEIVMQIFDLLKSEDTVIIVDPVAADNGKLYSIFDSSFPREMRKLCSKADVIVPNITEALFLLDEEYREGPYTVEYICRVLRKLTELGPSKIFLTGISTDDTHIGVACLDSKTGEEEIILREKIGGFFHGTGDIFASTLTAALLNGLSVSKAAQISADFTVDGIKRTYDSGLDKRFGINFEAGISTLADRINSLK